MSLLRVKAFKVKNRGKSGAHCFCEDLISEEFYKLNLTQKLRSEFMIVLLVPAKDLL
jgi:hypothetical protein